MNVGEELCGEWLRHVKGCEFIQYNVQLSDVQGELDVLGINLRQRVVYICEVAVHLATGLQYVKDKRPDNVGRLTAKFRKNIEFARTAFEDYEHVFMVWSPIVKATGNAVYNQVSHVEEVVATVHRELKVRLEPVINQRFYEAMRELREVAGNETKELDSSVMRFLQVEEHLKKHLMRVASAAEKAAAKGALSPLAKNGTQPERDTNAP